MNFKLGFGPMSNWIIEAICDFAQSNDTELAIIASRNQVDNNDGYVCTTEELVKKVNKNPYIKICRDHCGPYFLDSQKNSQLIDEINKVKETIYTDIQQGFDLIHIDTSRCQDQFGIAEELIKFSLDLKPELLFEFGTEENIGLETNVSVYKNLVDFAKHFTNIRFVVAQTGSLVYETKQTGTFDINTVPKLVEIATNANVKLKEHNADYLDAAQIALRRQIGIHAMNIAPQLGVVQTMTILDLADKFKIDTSDFTKTVIDSLKWKKWTDSKSDKIMVASSGHYCYNTDTYKNLCDKLKFFVDVESEVKSNIKSVIKLYHENFVV